MSPIIPGSETLFWQAGTTGCVLLHGFTALPAKNNRQGFDRLPANCPGCNVPVRNHEVKWTGLKSGNRPYYGSNLPMSKS